MTRREQLIIALQQFVDEAEILGSDGRFMRYQDGQPVALFVAAAAELLEDLTARHNAAAIGELAQVRTGPGGG